MSNNPGAPKRFMLTDKQVAALCSVRPKTVLDWARKGLIPGAKKIGHNWRFVPDKVERWLGYAPGTMPTPEE